MGARWGHVPKAQWLKCRGRGPRPCNRKGARRDWQTNRQTDFPRNIVRLHTTPAMFSVFYLKFVHGDGSVKGPDQVNSGGWPRLRVETRNESIGQAAGHRRQPVHNIIIIVITCSSGGRARWRSIWDEFLIDELARTYIIRTNSTTRWRDACSLKRLTCKKRLLVLFATYFLMIQCSCKL